MRRERQGVVSIELYIITDISPHRRALGEERPFGGKAAGVALWEVIIPSARGLVIGNDSQWGSWYLGLKRSMATSFMAFEYLMTRAAIDEDLDLHQAGVPIGEFYKAVVGWYQTMTDIDFRKQHPKVTIALVPDVMAMLSILENEMSSGAELVAIGVE